jgi:hypothetical protein
MITELFKVGISAKVLRRVAPTLSDPAKEKLIQHILNERYNKIISQIPGGIEEMSVPFVSIPHIVLTDLPLTWSTIQSPNLTVPFFIKPKNIWEAIYNPTKFVGLKSLKKPIILRSDLQAYSNLLRDISATGKVPKLEDIVAKYGKNISPKFARYLLSNPKAPFYGGIPETVKESVGKARIYGKYIDQGIKDAPVSDAFAKLHEARELESLQTMAKMIGKQPYNITRLRILASNLKESKNPIVRRIFNFMLARSPALRVAYQGRHASHELPTLWREQRDIKKIAPLLIHNDTITNQTMKKLIGHRYSPSVGGGEYSELLKRVAKIKPEYIQQLSPKVRELVEAYIKNPKALPYGYNYITAPAFTDKDIEIATKGILGL